MKSPSRAALSMLSRLVDRGAATVEVPRREGRYGQPSGMIKVRIAESAALAEAARRALRSPTGT
ncbi:MAG: hypothetical protein ACAI25_15675 [Planctomycetota bacterium]